MFEQIWASDLGSFKEAMRKILRFCNLVVIGANSIVLFSWRIIVKRIGQSGEE